MIIALAPQAYHILRHCASRGIFFQSSGWTFPPHCVAVCEGVWTFPPHSGHIRTFHFCTLLSFRRLSILIDLAPALHIILVGSALTPDPNRGGHHARDNHHIHLSTLS